jgi:hypothetical protein
MWRARKGAFAYSIVLGFSCSPRLICQMCSKTTASNQLIYQKNFPVVVVIFHSRATLIATTWRVYTRAGGCPPSSVWRWYSLTSQRSRSATAAQGKAPRSLFTLCASPTRCDPPSSHPPPTCAPAVAMRPRCELLSHHLSPRPATVLLLDGIPSLRALPCVERPASQGAPGHPCGAGEASLRAAHE